MLRANLLEISLSVNLSVIEGAKEKIANFCKLAKNFICLDTNLSRK